jgi:hypothetical protein
MTIVEITGGMLRAARSLTGLSQQELADRAAISRPCLTTWVLRARRQWPRRRAAEQCDELAPFHCPMPPVLPTERIAHLSRDCCAAGFQSGL